MKKILPFVGATAIFGLLCLWFDIILALVVSAVVYFGLITANKHINPE